MNTISSGIPEETSGTDLEQHTAQSSQSASTAKQQSGAARVSRYLLALLIVVVLALVGLVVWGVGQIGAAQGDAQAARADAQRAQAAVQGAQATEQTAQSDTAAVRASLVRLDALRLAAEANNLRIEGGPNELIALLSIRSMNMQSSPQGDTALSAAARLAYPVRQFTGHTDEVHGVAISPDGKYLATAAADRTAALWDLATGKQLHVFTGYTDWSKLSSSPPTASICSRPVRTGPCASGM